MRNGKIKAPTDNLGLFETKRPLKIVIGYEDLDSRAMNRFMTDVFEVKGGLVFLDYGWCVNTSSFPVHYIKGKIEGDAKMGYWEIDSPDYFDVVVMVIDDPKDSLLREWAAWEDFKKTAPEGKWATREKALECAKRSFPELFQ